MGRSSLVSVRLSSNNMSSKTLLFLLGAFVLFALSEALSEEKSRDIQKVEPSVERVIREADARKNKGGKQRRRRLKGKKIKAKGSKGAKKNKRRIKKKNLK